MSEEKSRLREADKKIEELEKELKSVQWSRDLFKSGMDIGCEVGSKAQTELTASQEALAKIMVCCNNILNTPHSSSKLGIVTIHSVAKQAMIELRETCSRCNGTKKVTYQVSPEVSIEKPCLDCQEVKKLCSRCSGTKKITYRTTPLDGIETICPDCAEPGSCKTCGGSREVIDTNDLEIYPHFVVCPDCKVNNDSR